MRAMFQAASQDRGPVLKRKDIKQWIIDADGSGADAPSEAQVSQIMTQIDRNCDGVVDSEEFSAFVEVRSLDPFLLLCAVCARARARVCVVLYSVRIDCASDAVATA